MWKLAVIVFVALAVGGIVVYNATATSENTVEQTNELLRKQLVKERETNTKIQGKMRREIRSLRRVAHDVRYPTPAGNQRLGAAYFGNEWPCAREISEGETAGTFRHDIAYGMRYGENLIYSGLAYGLGQARPGTKMLRYGADAASNPLTQWEWFEGYSEERYGSVCAAAAHWTPTRSW